MKKIFNSLFVIIASMVAFSACVKEENSPASETKTVQFFAESIETKTHFDAPVSGKYPTLWDEGDKVKILLNLESPSGVGDLEKTVTISEISTDFKSASFKAELNTEYSFPSYTFYAVVPSTAYNAKSSAEGRFTVIIPANQTPQEGSVDKAAQVLYAISETSSTMPSSVPMTFKHYTAYGKLSLSNLTSKISTVSSITLESAGAGLAGKWNYFVADGSVAAREGSDKLTLTTSATENIWFACAPVDMSGKELVLTVNTDKGPLSKTITFPANRKFESGKISVFTVDMAGIEPEEPSESSQYYVKVTDNQDDWSGKYLIVFGNNAHATLSGKDLNSTCSVTIKDDKIAATDAIASAVMTVTKSGDKYCMTYPDGKYFSMAKNASGSSTSAFDLMFDYTNVGVKISGIADNVTYILYSNGGQYFRCYVEKNGQAGYNLPTLYKLEVESEGGETPEDYLTVSETEINVNADATTASFTVSSNLEWTATSDDAEVAVNGNEVNVKFEANTTDIEHLYTVVISANGVESKTVTITQAAGGESDGVRRVTVNEFKKLTGSESATYELSGVVSKIYDPFSSQYNNISFYIKDETGDVLIFRMSCEAELGNSIRVGDQITVQGKPTLYSNSIQMAQGGVCVNYVAAPYVEFEEEAVIVDANIQTFTLKISSNTNWTLSASEGISLGETSGTGDKEVVITFPANETSEMVSYTLTLSSDKSTAIFVLTQNAKSTGNEPETESATLSFANKAQRTSFSTTKQVWEQNGIKLVNEKSSSTSNVADYANPARFYKSSKITVEAPGNITKIEFTCNNGSYATALKSSIQASLGTISVSGNVVTIIPNDSATTFVVSSLTGGQVRMNSLTVTYEK